MSEQTTEQSQATAAPAAEKSAPPPVKAILAQKIGMTQVLSPTGEFVPVTVLQAGPCPVLQVKTAERDGYTAIQLGFGNAKAKNVNKPFAGHAAAAGAGLPQWIREVRVKDVKGFEAGQQIRAAHFVVGDSVDVTGVNKGKGYAGVVKRHRFRGGPKTHGQSDRWRAPGSSGGQLPQKSFPGRRGPGHMGAVRSTVQRLEVVRVDADKNLMLLRGAVPGPNGGRVLIQQTIRPRAKKAATVAKPVAKAKK